MAEPKNEDFIDKQHFRDDIINQNSKSLPSLIDNKSNKIYSNNKLQNNTTH